MLRTIFGVLAILSLTTGCVTTREMSAAPTVVGMSDSHLTFRGFSVRERKNGISISAWVKPAQSLTIGDYQLLHIDMEKAGTSISRQDVRLRINHGGRARRHRTSLFSAELPSEAAAADVIRVSHVHARHSDHAGLGEVK
jgi:hypothetical protein